jgi:hypothetical protein
MSALTVTSTSKTLTNFTDGKQGSRKLDHAQYVPRSKYGSALAHPGMLSSRVCKPPQEVDPSAWRGRDVEPTNCACPLRARWVGQWPCFAGTHGQAARAADLRMSW